MAWEHGNEELKKFLETLDCYHPTKVQSRILQGKNKLSECYCHEKGNQLVTDLYVKPTDTHQDLHSSSCHVSYCKKSKSFNQALRLNRIYSENAFFGKRCNELARCMAKRKRLQ